MLFLHGFTGSPQSGDRLKSLLGDAAEPWLAPSLIGHGATSEATSFEQEVDRLLKQVRGSERVVAYSMGARLALAMACAKPACFAEIVLVGVHPGLADEDERAARRAEDEARATSLEAHGTADFVRKWEMLPLFQEETLAEEERAERRSIRLSHSAEGLARALRVVGLGQMPNLWPKLASLTMPVTFVAGEHDHKFRRLAERASRATRRSRAVTIEGAGHDALLKAPRAIASLLSRPRAQRSEPG